MQETHLDEAARSDGGSRSCLARLALLLNADRWRPSLGAHPERRKDGARVRSPFAQDSVPHDQLLRLEQLDVPPRWIGLIRRLYTGNTGKTHMGEATSGEITVTRGLRQGCPLSPLLHILYVTRLEAQLLASGLFFSLQHLALEEGENVDWGAERAHFRR